MSIRDGNRWRLGLDILAVTTTIFATLVHLRVYEVLRATKMAASESALLFSFPVFEWLRMIQPVLAAVGIVVCILIVATRKLGGLAAATLVALVFANLIGAVVLMYTPVE